MALTHQQLALEPDSTRGWALVFLLGPCEGKSATGEQVPGGSVESELV